MVRSRSGPKVRIHPLSWAAWWCWLYIGNRFVLVLGSHRVGRPRPGRRAHRKRLTNMRSVVKDRLVIDMWIEH